jgi:hypothetical protein
VDKSQGLHSPSGPRVALDERVKCFTVASDSAIGLEVSGAWWEEPQMVKFVTLDLFEFTCLSLKNIFLVFFQPMAL